MLDPFAIRDGWFALEFVAFQVKLGPAATGAVVASVEETIETLGLNLPECCVARGAYVEEYEQGHNDLNYLERRAPFVAREMRRQGKLLRGDA